MIIGMIRVSILLLACKLSEGLSYQDNVNQLSSLILYCLKYSRQFHVPFTITVVVKLYITNYVYLLRNF
jgi:hypothetical protein